MFHGGVWGTVCSKGWDLEDAHVVCRELGYPEARGIIPTYYGAGSGMIWMDHVACTGDEVSLSDCAHRGWGTLTHVCTHDQDIRIRCKGVVTVVHDVYHDTDSKYTQKKHKQTKTKL